MINDGRTIDIDFGKVGIKRIDGNRYMQRIDYSIKCEFLDNSRQLKMKIMGGAAAFDGSVLTSSVNGLGIKLLANGKAFAINTPLNIDYANPPTLDAVPVKNSAVTLAEGDFTSSATMLGLLLNTRIPETREAATSPLRLGDNLAPGRAPPTSGYFSRKITPNHWLSFIITISQMRLKKLPSFTSCITTSGCCSMVLPSSWKSMVPTT